MPRTIAAALDEAIQKLRNAASGLPEQLSNIAQRDHVALKPVCPDSVILLNAPSDLLDQALDTVYPQVLLFADQMENAQKERFSAFSGTVRLGIDVRISSETPGRLESDLHRYVEAVLGAVAGGTPQWSDGIVCGGRYSVSYAPVRLAGSNFLQSARIILPLEQFVPA